MNYKGRIRILSLFVLVFAGLIVFKLYLVQVVHGSQYRGRADHQYVKPTDHIFDRGTIYFQYKDGTLYGAATVRDGFTVAINPKIISNPEEIYQKINHLSPLDYTSFLNKANKKNDPYEEIAKRVPEEQGRAIDSLNIKGVLLSKDRWRYYPGGTMAAHVLGIIGYGNNTQTNDEIAGRYGLEKQYQTVLQRTDGLYVNFFAEIFSDLNKGLRKDDSLDGDVITTIEPNVQMYLQKQVEGIQQKWKSDLTGGIIMDPKTGEVYAMAAAPTFDPNNFQNQKDLSVFKNPMVQNVYELGSVVKALTMAAGLDAGVITANTTYNNTGYIILNGKKISNFDQKDTGTVNMQKVLNDSLNTGAVFVMQKLGIKPFSNYMRSYGLGTQTGIDLPNEAIGLIGSLNSSRDVEHATASFGQGIAVTPIALIRALSSLANGGYLPTPHLVKRIEYTVGISKNIKPENGLQVIKKQTSDEISRMLTVIVDKALANGAVKLPHYSVAAKTGTAQMPDGKGGYYTDRYLHSFFGYFPSYNPRFIVLLFTVYPKTPLLAAQTLTSPFIDITKFMINYYEIIPDR